MRECLKYQRFRFGRDFRGGQVARKLAVLLHKLWTTGEVYEPLRNSPARQRRQKVAA